MTILNKNWLIEFPFPTVIRTVVCSDLDETYIPSDSDKKTGGGSFSWTPILHPMLKKRDSRWLDHGNKSGFSLAKIQGIYLAKPSLYMLQSRHRILLGEKWPSHPL